MFRPGKITTIAVFGVLFCAWTVGSGTANHSYLDYLAEWRAVLAGRAPWQPGPDLPINAYGPLFNLLALFDAIAPVAPKLLFALAYVAFVAWLALRVAPQRADAMDRRVLWLCVLNPVPWIEIAHFGFFDVLVGVACVAAVHDARSGRDWRSGVWLGAGVLLKFVPVVLLPFLALSGRRLRPRVIAGALLIAAAGFSTSLAIWGWSTLDPLRFAGARVPVMSIYDVLGSSDSPLSLGLPFDLGLLEKPLLVVAGGATLAWCLWRRVDRAPAAVMATLVTLLFYRSGYNNYQMIPLLLLAYWFAVEPGVTATVRNLVPATGAWIGTLLAIDAGFPLLRRLVSANLATLYLEASYLARFVAGCMLVIVVARGAAQPSTKRGPASPAAPAASSLL